MALTPIQNVWFDDAATLAMGEAFDNACKPLRNLGSAVPEIIAGKPLGNVPRFFVVRFWGYCGHRPRGCQGS
jgi:hypothetical protein